MRDELYKLQKAANDLDSYLYGCEEDRKSPVREEVMNMVHSLNMAYGAWAWDVDKGLELEVD